MKTFKTGMLMFFIVCILFMYACSEKSGGSGGEGDAESEGIIGGECLVDEDCDAGLICENGYCIDSNPGDGDQENGGDFIDGEALMVLTGAPVDFGAPIIFNQTQRTLEIASAGEGTLQIDSIELDGSTSDEYVLENAPGEAIYLNPGESFSLIISYTPQDAGVEDGLLKIYSNDENNSVTSVDLKAYYKGTPDIETDLDSIDFGNAQVNGISVSSCVKVSNIPVNADDNIVIEISTVNIKSGDSQTFELTSETKNALPILLPPNGEEELCVIFHPKSEDEFEDALVIYNDDPDTEEQELELPLIGAGVVPRLQIEPAAVDFGDTKLNAVVNEPVVLTNIGGWPLKVSSAYMKPGSSADFTVDTLGNIPSGGVDVQPGANVQVMVRYAPTAVGLDTGHLVVISSDPANGQMETAVNGNGVYSTISASPTSLLFPDTPLWTTSALTLTLKNEGNAEVNVQSVDFSNTLEGIVSLVDAATVLPAVICAGTVHEGCVEELELIFDFAPADETHYSGSVDILTDDENSNLNVLASGNGVMPHAEFDPEAGSTIDFGDICIGGSSEQLIEVTNSGNYDLEVTGLPEDGVLGSCTIEPVGSLLTVEPGQTEEIAITCSPQGPYVGPIEENLSLTTNDPENSEIQFDLTMTAVDPIVDVTPNEELHDFGEVLIGLSGVPVQYTIRNTGSGSLFITGVALASGSSNSYAIEGLPPTKRNRLNVELRPVTLYPEDSLSFTVAYRPLTEDTHIGKVVITSNDCNVSEYEIDLSGSGVGCAEDSHLCGSECVSSSDVAHCGASCNPCFEPPNGSALCEETLDGWACGFECDPNYAPKDDGCAPIEECCGAGCIDCTMLNPPHSTPFCIDNTCDFTCDFNYHEDGVLCALNAAPTCCGESCVNCTLLTEPNQDAYCIDEACDFLCSEGYEDCSVQAGCETSIINNLSNCGACNYVCDEHATANMHATSCSNYLCQYACDSGYSDCSSSQAGCETNINQNINNCGTCNYVCSQHNPVHAHPTACSSGQCQFDCDSGYKDCTGSDGNCETATDSDVYNCGACNWVCLSHKPANTHVKNCTYGECIYECNSNYGDCTVADGCETYLLTSTEHCGQCNYDCDDHKPLHAQTKSCGASGCVFECITPWNDCNGDGSCETDLTSDPNNCGICYKDCDNFSPTNMHATGCNSNVCQFACNDGYGDCSSIAGCETSTASNTSHCGACNYVCSQNTPPNTSTTGCSGGQCQYACVSNYLDCTIDPGCETYKLTNASHCGACNYACADHAPPHMHSTGCSSGVCQYECDTGWSDCNSGVAYPGCETPTGTDANNCGTCGYICTSHEPPNSYTESCTSSQCIFKCDAGYGDCTTSVGCETNVYVDLSNCGTCNNACAASVPPNMLVADCDTGVCEYSCQPGYKDCTTSPGCETNSNTDVNNCGACNNKCSDSAPPHMHAASCSNGNCQYACDTGYSDCTPDAGCETYIYSDMSNCGACNYSCAGHAPYQSTAIACSNYACQYECNEDYGDCNSGGGCETDLTIVGNLCESGTTMYRNDGSGSIRGDDGADVTYQYSGYGTTWYKVTVTDENSGLSPDSISVRFHLEVPPGVDYDLEIRDTCDTLVGYSESGLEGEDEIIDVTWSDTPIWDDDRTIYVKIYLYSGNNCGNWSLTASGNVHRM